MIDGMCEDCYYIYRILPEKKIIKLSKECPECGIIHELEVPFLFDCETGSIRCFCGHLIEFEIKEIINN